MQDPRFPNSQQQAAADTAAHPGAGRGLGIAAIICGGVGVCVPGPALIGLVLGIVGLVAARPGQKKLPGIGTGVSAGGLVLNAVLMVALLIPAIQRASDAAAMLKEQQQLAQIGVGYMAWSVDNKAMFPDHAADIEPYLAGNTDLFIAPPAMPGDVPLVKNEDRPTEPYVYGSFEFMPLGGISMDQISDPAKMLIAHSAKPAGPDGRFYACLFMDGHTEQLEQPAFEQARKRTLDLINSMKRRR